MSKEHIEILRCLANILQVVSKAESNNRITSEELSIISSLKVAIAENYRIITRKSKREANLDSRFEQILNPLEKVYNLLNHREVGFNASSKELASLKQIRIQLETIITDYRTLFSSYLN